MADPEINSLLPETVTPDDSARAPVTATPEDAAAAAVSNSSSTRYFQIRLNKAPVWFCSLMASNQREKRRFRDELVHIKGAWPLLMKQRNGGTWTPEDKFQLKAMVHSASSVSPYLFIWAIPGSMLLLPFLAWYLDRKRRNRVDKAAP